MCAFGSSTMLINFDRLWLNTELCMSIVYIPDPSSKVCP